MGAAAGNSRHAAPWPALRRVRPDAPPTTSQSTVLPASSAWTRGEQARPRRHPATALAIRPAAPSPRLPPVPPHSSGAWESERFFARQASWVAAPLSAADLAVPSYAEEPEEDEETERPDEWRGR